MSLIDLLMGAGLLLTVACFMVWGLILFLSVTAPRFIDKTKQRPYWQAFFRKFTVMAEIGKPTQGYSRVFVWYIERFL